MLDLRFWGRGAAFYPLFGNTNAYFEADGDLYFIDFGESTFEKVFRAVDFSRYRDVYVLLTHLHADHSGSLASLISYAYCVLDIRVKVIHPMSKVNDLLEVQGISTEFYEYREMLPEGLAVSAHPVEVPHAKNMRCFGYVITFEEDSLYYSGDASELPDSILESFLRGDIKRIYQDTAGHESQSHCCYKRLEELIPSAERARVFAMHFDGDYVELVRSKGFSVVEVAPINSSR